MAVLRYRSMPSQNGRINFRTIGIICDCGEKYFVVDFSRSKMPPMGRDRRNLIEVSKEVSDHYAESSDGFFTCPECEVKSDLSTAGKSSFER